MSIWQMKHPQANEHALGCLPGLISEEDPRGAADQVDENYIQGWTPESDCTISGDTLRTYWHRPDDPPLQLTAEAQLRDETLRFYSQSRLAIFQPNGSFEVSRVSATLAGISRETVHKALAGLAAYQGTAGNDWMEFHEANPQIYEVFCTYVDEIIDLGFKKYRSTGIWAVMSMDLDKKAGPESHIYSQLRKYCPYYARSWMEQHPEHPKFFKKRSRAIGRLIS
jgi:hypothetical protein